MGAGKTTVGRQLAKRLVRPFLDSDHEIVARTGVPIPTIFEIEGEDGFRRREAQTIHELTESDNLVMATGGGVVINPENRQRLHDTGWVVYLDVPPAIVECAGSVGQIGGTLRDTRSSISGDRPCRDRWFPSRRVRHRSVPCEGI